MAFWTLRRKFAALGVLLVVLVLGWGVVVVAVAVSGAREQAATADAIAVLGAAQYNGRPSPVFKARLDHAATLYLRGYAPVVLVTGGVGSRGIGQHRDDRGGAGVADDLQVPRRAVGELHGVHVERDHAAGVDAHKASVSVGTARRWGL